LIPSRKNYYFQIPSEVQISHEIGIYKTYNASLGFPDEYWNTFIMIYQGENKSSIITNIEPFFLF